MRTEIQRLREKLEASKQEVRNKTQVVEELPLLRAEIQEQAQTKVESNSKFPMNAFGHIVSNFFWKSRVGATRDWRHETQWISRKEPERAVDLYNQAIQRAPLL